MNVHGLFCFVVYMVILCHLHTTGKIKDSNISIKSAVKAVLLSELQITETEHLVNNTDKEKTEEERLSGSLIEYTVIDPN